MSSIRLGIFFLTVDCPGYFPACNFEFVAFVCQNLDGFCGLSGIGLALSRACISWCLDVFTRWFRLLDF